MTRKGLALLLAAVLALGCIGCGASDKTTQSGGGSTQYSSNSGGKKDEQSTAPETGSFSPENAVRGLTMSVSRDTGELSVKRVALPSKNDAAQAEEKWTLFIYLCGTDLETNYGGATGDLIEMLDGAVGDGVRFVVETGGAYDWNNNMVGSGTLQRYLLEGEDINLVDEQSRASMGKPDTFADFLQWGVENYPSEHMGVILWDHGGGSITGVCFDETEQYDSLSLRELDGALLTVCGGMGRKFDFIGFDACLMGTLETAGILASYADYMIGSEEVEPGSGWDYTSIGKYLGKNPGADTEGLGKIVCDSFIDACRAYNVDELCTLAVIDLSKLDDLLVAFNDFAHGMYDSAAEAAERAAMIRGIGDADNFGGNNRSEGYTNMVDMGGLISACADYSSGAKKALRALSSAVVYSVAGSAHPEASGLSLYYPLSVQGSQELNIFADVCPSPYYISFVDRQNQGGVDIGSAENYDDNTWFNGNGEWEYGNGEGDEGHWEYLEGFQQTGESPYITFDVEPYLSEDGEYIFVLDKDGFNNTADVHAVVYEYSVDKLDLIELGVTYDLDGNWRKGEFVDGFYGTWMSLPDGQNLATYVVEVAEDYILYTSPIQLNGEDTNLRFRFDPDTEEITVDGAWSGVNEQGASSREITKIEKGDTIVPLYYGHDIKTGEDIPYHGNRYTVSGKFEINYEMMEDGDYLYAFWIDDVFGDYYLTDCVTFFIDYGEVLFDPDQTPVSVKS